MYNSVYLQIEKEYEQKRKRAEDKLETKKQELRNIYPEYAMLEDKINTSAINHTKNIIILKGEEKRLATYNFEIELKKLNEEVEFFLHKNNLPMNYLKPRYECDICKDTGVILQSIDNGKNRCKCFTQRLMDMVYNQNNMLKLVEENFNTFSTKYFSDVPNKEKYKSEKSPQENIINIQNISKNFILNLKNDEQKSLLFIGSTGTGKTFMCNAIAKDAIDKGYTLLYQTAPLLMDMVLESKFKASKDEKFKEKYEQIFDVDLLIIDDLGTETLNDFKFTELFNIVNTRLLKSKKTIISTNLTLTELATQYDARVISRIVGNYIVCKFYGEDVRLKKKKMLDKLQ